MRIVRYCRRLARAGNCGSTSQRTDNGSGNQRSGAHSQQPQRYTRGE
jgi:hypothetical protein